MTRYHPVSLLFRVLWLASFTGLLVSLKIYLIFNQYSRNREKNVETWKLRLATFVNIILDCYVISNNC